MKSKHDTLIIPFNKVGMGDVSQVGGKVASLGEMIKHLTRKKINVPNGFCVTAYAFKSFIQSNNLELNIKKSLKKLRADDIRQLQKTSNQIKKLIMASALPTELAADLKNYYDQFTFKGTKRFAVRSSATCEDSSKASFAGLHDSILHVTTFSDLKIALKTVFASMYNARALGYRADKNIPEDTASMAVGIQAMVNADKATSGVMFTLDTETGFDKVILINATYGLGESIVQGLVNPDEFILYKPNLVTKKDAILRRTIGSKQQKIIYKKKCLQTVEVNQKQQRVFCITDAQATQLAEQALKIEQHYGRPMDIEWAIDSLDNKLYIVQARPETVESGRNHAAISQYKFIKKGKQLCSGRSVGGSIGVGAANVIDDLSQMETFEAGSVLVTDITNPDWEPIMKKASAIVTNRGGRTCHAAIIARELGIPAVVGTIDGTNLIKHGQTVTVSCAQGDEGYIYQGRADFSVKHILIDTMPKIPVNITMNLGNPDKAFDYQFIPNEGVGLARIEFIISNMIGVHPNALIHFDKLKPSVKKEIAVKIAAYRSPEEFYIEKLKEGMAVIAAAFYPKEVIFRFSDFKSNEYANLLGGAQFEPDEENPMLGYRGAGRYVSEQFHDAFRMECAALKRVRETMGLTNAQIMIPFARTVAQAKQVVQLMRKFGLVRGKKGLKVYMMCEIPSNAILAEEFLQYFDGFSIGSNDLTQLTFGLDRDSELVADLFDERDPAMKELLARVIKTCRKAKKYVGICGQGPSDYPDFAAWLVQQGISSISLSPDSVVNTWLHIARNSRADFDAK